jgi:hypothetical protein
MGSDMAAERGWWEGQKQEKKVLLGRRGEKREERKNGKDGGLLAPPWRDTQQI